MNTPRTFHIVGVIDQSTPQRVDLIELGISVKGLRTALRLAERCRRLGWQRVRIGWWIFR